MNKKLLIFLLFTIILTSFVSAGPLDVLDNFPNYLGEIGNLNFMGVESQVVGLLRILVGILVFTIFYVLAGALSHIGDSELFSQRQAVVVALILSIITSIFIPSAILITFGGSLGILVSTLLLSLIFGGIGFLIYHTDTPSRSIAFIKSIFVVITLYVISLMGNVLNKYQGAMVSDEFSSVVTFFNKWLYWIFFIILIHMLWKTIKGGDDNQIDTSNWPKPKIDGLKKFFNTEKTIEEFTMREYDYLTKIKSVIEKSTSDNIAQNIRRLIRLAGKFGYRERRHLDAIKKLSEVLNNHDQIDQHINKLDIFNGIILKNLDSIGKISTQNIPFEEKKNAMLELIEEAIKADQGMEELLNQIKNEVREEIKHEQPTPSVNHPENSGEKIQDEIKDVVDEEIEILNDDIEDDIEDIVKGQEDIKIKVKHDPDLKDMLDKIVKEEEEKSALKEKIKENLRLSKQARASSNFSDFVKREKIVNERLKASAEQLKSRHLNFFKNIVNNNIANKSSEIRAHFEKEKDLLKDIDLKIKLREQILYNLSNNEFVRNVSNFKDYAKKEEVILRNIKNEQIIANMANYLRSEKIKENIVLSRNARTASKFKGMAAKEQKILDDLKKEAEMEKYEEMGSHAEKSFKNPRVKRYHNN
jgi:hypothetical protein